MAVLHQRSRFTYSGSHREESRVLERGKFEIILGKYLSQAGMSGEHSVVVTRVCVSSVEQPLSLLGKTRFGIDCIYTQDGKAYLFYLEVPIGKTPEQLWLQFVKVGVPVGVAPEEKKYSRLGRIPNRVFHPNTSPKRILKKEKVIRLQRLPKIVQPKKSEHVLWNILTIYKVSKSEKELLLSDAPPIELLDDLAERAYKVSDWKSLAVINSIIEAL